MRLQKLEINGFKSFADKVDFEFEPGVTAFVGPNGCGKSNVVDAVRWILGEQSPKAIRGGTMQDIIFNGGGARKPKGYAEASLTILNDRGILPVDYTEVCVTRRLFRTGESEYLINKQPCRLRDIREMFMDTGVGMQTYSIIEQGRVARLLQANPVERRAVFEEAAGISKYKVQRRAAQAKLDRTLENLERAQMLASEKEARLRSIKNQAAKARRWQEYQERLREIQYSLSLHTWRKAEALRRKALDEIAASEGMAAELAHQLASAEAALAAIEQEAAETERLHDETQRSLHQVETQRQAAQQNIRRNTDLISEYDAAAEEAAASLQTLESRLARAREELTRARAELEELHQLVQAQTQAAREQTRSAQESANECLRIEQSLDRWKSEIIESAHRAVQLRNEINNLVNSQQQDTARRARLDERRAATDKALQELNEAAARLTEQRLALDARLESGRVALEDTERRRLETLGLVATADDGLRAQREREAALAERRRVLADLDASAQDVADGVRWLLRPERRPGGVLGMVADLIHVDLANALAIESALADRAQTLITQDTPSALAALRLLREGEGGRAAILPLDRARAQAQTPDLAGQPGVVGRAMDMIRCDDAVRPALASLIGGVWIVDTFDAAADHSAGPGAAATLVTLHGDVLEPGGVITGGAALRRVGIISRRSELEQLDRDLQELAAQIAALELERSRGVELAEDLARQAARGREQLDEDRRQRHVLDTDLQDLQRQRQRIEEEQRLLLGEIAEIDNNLITGAAREEQVRRDLAAAETARQRIEADIEAAQARLAVQREDAARLRDQAHELKLELARREQRLESLRQAAASHERAQDEIEQQIETTSSAIAAYARKREESQAQITASQDEERRLEAAHAELAAELESILVRRQSVRESRATETARCQTLRASHADATSRLTSLRVEENRHALQMQNTEEKLQAAWGATIAQVAELEKQRLASTPPPEPGASPQPEPDWNALAQEAAELQRKIQSMGGVNTDALAEQEQIEADLKWQIEQRADLEEAEKQLRQIIRKINRLCKEKFEEAFAKVAENFAELFRKLFGGGSAELRLIQQEGEDILDAGIDIIARPPGKEPKSIIQLSGGEQTMTTIALVFAIFKWKPSPFCILDEVDAALDEANIDRFCAMVKEFLNFSQFIVITHSKRTMGLADTLYGVTMMEQGVSTKLAVKMEEAAKLVA